jgi:hypothetical protein
LDNYFPIMGIFDGEVCNNLFVDNVHAIDAAFEACSLLVKNNTISGCTELGIGAAGGSWTVIKNVFHHNPSPTQVLELAFLSESDTAYVASNLFYRDREGQGHLPLSTVAVGGTEVVNNTLVGPYTRGQQRAIRCGPPLPVSSSRNNTISDFGYAFQTSHGTVLNVSYTNIWDVDGYDIGDGEANYLEGNVFADPMFEDSTSYRLQMYSPLIDAGDPDILDVDGTRSDIGCYGGPHGCSYVYLDLAPQIPDSITVHIEEEIVILDWRFNTEADFNRYQVFRDTVSGFEPTEFNMIAEPDSSYYADEDIDPGLPYYYRLASVDNQGNVSDYSDEVAAIPTGIIYSDDGNVLPRYTVIESAYPNPFNSNVTIIYSASNLGPQPPQVRLPIFDIQGRLVRTLVDERQPMGTYRAVWDGRDDVGWPVSSGVYFARLYQWDCPGGDFPVKITLVK